MAKSDPVLECQQYNFRVFMEDGPRLSTSYRQYVVARDRLQGMALLGGVGPVGVGQMWVDDCDDHAELPGYEDAEERDYATDDKSALYQLNVESEANALRKRTAAQIEKN